MGGLGPEYGRTWTKISVKTHSSYVTQLMLSMSREKKYSSNLNGYRFRVGLSLIRVPSGITPCTNMFILSKVPSIGARASISSIPSSSHLGSSSSTSDGGGSDSPTGNRCSLAMKGSCQLNMSTNSGSKVNP